MSLPGKLLRFTDTVHVYSDDGVEEVDIYGNVTYQELPPVAVKGCVVLPATMDELHQPGRDWTLAGYDVFMPTASAHLVDSSSRVRWDGLEWVVEGEPRRWRNPYTGTNFVQFRIERASG